LTFSTHSSSIIYTLDDATKVGALKRWVLEYFEEN
jgi:hypothetical protein